MTAQTSSSIASKMHDALSNMKEGVVSVLNVTGPEGDEALALVMEAMETGAGTDWVVGSDADGDCFFATTDVMIALMAKGYGSLFKVCTGVFTAQTQAKNKEPIIHAWLEYSRNGKTCVVNCSNLSRRPLYAMDKDTYTRVNNCKERIQRLDAPLVQRKLRGFLTSQGQPLTADAKIDVSAFTKQLLRRTIYQRSLQASHS